MHHFAFAAPRKQPAALLSPWPILPGGQLLALPKGEGFPPPPAPRWNVSLLPALLLPSPIGRPFLSGCERPAPNDLSQTGFETSALSHGNWTEAASGSPPVGERLPAKTVHKSVLRFLLPFPAHGILHLLKAGTIPHSPYGNRHASLLS